MHLLPLTVFAVVILFVMVEAETCFDKHDGCHSTDYHSYVNCVRRRHKRSSDCEYSCNSGNCIDTCNNCDCDSCTYNNCQNSCNSCCSTCCSNYIPCRTNHCCHRTCQAQCDTSKCRSTCRRNCFDTVRKHTETVYVPQPSGESGQSSSQNSSIINNSRHNVTTIIHLNNVINNTNIIDVPININNTNDQNITLYTAENSRKSQKEQCCTVIGPRQCVSYPTPKCFHYRSNQCGAYCTANIVHKEEKQVCESYYPGAPVNCKQQIYYIPQPTPRCVYQSMWPYVSCSIQNSYSGCAGCYNHYVDQSSSNYLQCSPQCYDDGYHVGPMYRQGPIYRPMYSHAPPVYYNQDNTASYGYSSNQNFYNPYQALSLNMNPSYFQTENEILIPENATSVDLSTKNRELPIVFDPLIPISKDGQYQANVEPFSSQAQIDVGQSEKFKRAETRVTELEKIIPESTVGEVAGTTVS